MPSTALRLGDHLPFPPFALEACDAWERLTAHATVAASVVAAAIADVAVRRLGLLRCYSLVNRARLAAAPRSPASEREWRTLRLVEWAVVQAVRAYPFGGTCVHRSLVLAFLLRLLSLDARVHWGVQKYPFEAHAWVESGGHVVGDATWYISRYKRLST